ncbi:pentatricopeptide repeat-containing protein At1g06140, mitochondrial [Amborella trichopoda]|nr:pentatricopeptide repeat-containing protein At1g06140, mitochondrial [Amborella trichopoda]|eukprot:XP_011625899.1 pentatricopeptide repeat-containing protein At1g06140, mitochondrial [Amborella trichopoda]
MPQRTRHYWNAIISASYKNAFFSETLNIYKKMCSHGFKPESFNMVFAIKACVRVSLLSCGKTLHSSAVKLNLERDSYVVPAIINMYVRFHCLDEARRVFDKMCERNWVSWGAMIRGYVKVNRAHEAFDLYFEMKRLGFELDPFVAVGLVQACGLIFSLKEGKATHGYGLRRQVIFYSDIYFETSLLNMYLKCGSLDCSTRTFEGMNRKDLVSWSAMVSGLVQNGRASEAIDFFSRMLLEKIQPNLLTLSSVLSAFSQLGSLKHGKSIHGYLFRFGLEPDAIFYTCLIDTYTKCGALDLGRRIFDSMPQRSVFSWSAMISGYGTHGLGSGALELFKSMLEEGLNPEPSTLVSVLSACSHSGLVDKGWEIFNSMEEKFGIRPVEDHYACMVDMLGRAGLIEESELFISEMPIEPGGSVWGALMGACKIHKNVELAERVAEKLFVLEPDRPDAYVMLSNVYASMGLWEGAERVREMMRERGLKKSHGFSSV